MNQPAEKPNYKKTINRPSTSFSMKANLVQNEPASQKRWDQMKLYQKLRDKPHPRGPFVFHDGPPYANGSIHLGHLLNKVMKDFVVRSRTMMGYDVPYIPGWDCHGLPIEHKVMQEKKSRQATEPASHEQASSGSDQTMHTRKACRKYAEKFVKLQATQMQRLLTTADYDQPYLTMNPGYEAAVLEVFADLVARGLVYRGLKPVHWSIDNQTALADAELEYYDREDTSVYVLFELQDTGGLPATHLMIWTTTPWTLPANRAVAVSEQAEYGVYDVNGGKVILAVDLAAKVLGMEGVDAPEPEQIVTGDKLVGLTYHHPLQPDHGPCPVVAADYVTLEDGTGLVHTAPGHGVEDYQTGLREGLEIYCPVQFDGTFDDTAPQFLAGKTVWQGNDLVVEHLKQAGTLFHRHQFTHSYPHDWRGKTPVIFRATEQWFVDVDKPFVLPGENDGEAKSLKQRALDVTASAVDFFPGWGRNRMRGMLESRPDWCLSRQRAWGLPIPAFYMPGEDQPLLTPASVQAVARVLAEKGSDAWFYMQPAQLLEHYNPADDDHAPDWAKSEIQKSNSEIQKSQDIFDVWFESGSSWHACMERRGLAYGRDGATARRPVTDLYLEGSDQHRGWFQLSLLPALGVTGQPPFAAVLTHGFMVDKHGRKMSKSLGNTLEVEDLLQQFGADVCRWWVSSLNTDNDIKVDEDFFKLAGEEYRKVRNTIRFLLSNLDFDSGDRSGPADDIPLQELDCWILTQLQQLIDASVKAYGEFRFRKVHEMIFNFCNDTLSAVYLAAVKDRLYCDPADSPRRLSTQKAIYRIATDLCLLLAPIMPHTADEAWRTLFGESECVHLHLFPDAMPFPDRQTQLDWPTIMALREQWLKQIEAFRQSHDVDNPLDLGFVASRTHVGSILNDAQLTDLADLLGVSRFELKDAGEPEVVDLRDEPRCERSWKRDGTVKQRSDGGMLSDRDAAALGV